MLKPTELSSSVTPLHESDSRSRICCVVSGRHALAFCPCVEPARYRWKNSAWGTATVLPVIGNHAVVCPVCLEDRHVISAGATGYLDRCVCDDERGVRSVARSS